MAGGGPESAVARAGAKHRRAPLAHTTRDGDLSALLLQAGAGSASAFAALFDLTSGQVHGISCAVYGDDSAAAMDATEAAFATIWRQAPAYPGAGDDARRWLLGVAVHAISTRGRSRGSDGSA